MDVFNADKASFLSSLADAARINILEYMVGSNGGSFGAHDISGATGLSMTSTRQHLRILSDQVVTVTIHPSKPSHYSISPEKAKVVRAILDTAFAHESTLRVKFDLVRGEAKTRAATDGESGGAKVGHGSGGIVLLRAE